MKDFGAFMSFGLIHADDTLEGTAKYAVKQLIKLSLENCKKFPPDFFKQPLFSRERENKNKLERNLTNFITFFYSYLQYAGPILQVHKPDIYATRFTDIKNHYTRFCIKYSIK